MFSLDALQCFHEDELEAMLCGVGEKWSVSKLAETIKCDHGCAKSFRNHPSSVPVTTDNAVTCDSTWDWSSWFNIGTIAATEYINFRAQVLCECEGSRPCVIDLVFHGCIL